MILYIETNFLMAIAKGQDLEAENLLHNPPQSVYIKIPSICYVEALSRWQQEKYYSQQFEKELNKQINHSQRDRTSPNAQEFLFHLEQSKILNISILNDVQERLINCIDLLVKNTELINLNTEIIWDIAQLTIIQPELLLIKNDLMDNLILKCILEDANLYTQVNKVFLSGNTNDFGKQEVQAALRSAGVRYFSRTQDFLGWLQSQNN